MQILLILLGLAFLGIDLKLLVAGTVAIAKARGISELIIGLTMVAAGTSLPDIRSR